MEDNERGSVKGPVPETKTDRGSAGAGSPDQKMAEFIANFEAMRDVPPTGYNEFYERVETWNWPDESLIYESRKAAMAR